MVCCSDSDPKVSKSRVPGKHWTERRMHGDDGLCGQKANEGPCNGKGIFPSGAFGNVSTRVVHDRYILILRDIDARDCSDACAVHFFVVSSWLKYPRHGLV